MPTQTSCPRCHTPLATSLPLPVTLVCQKCHLGQFLGPETRSLGDFPPLPGAQLAVGQQGTLEGQAFSIVGRMHLSQGKARWNEWALHTRLGELYYLSEAQGAFHLMRSRGLRPQAPAAATLSPGRALSLEVGEDYRVRERGQSVVMSVEGALPLEVSPGTRVTFVELNAAGSALASLEWREGDGAPPELWDGYPVSLTELGLEAQTSGAAGSSCASCQKTLELKLGAEAVMVSCPSCGHLNVRRDGVFQDAGVQEGQGRGGLVPLLHRSGTLRGESLQCVGVMQRRCRVEGEDYFWNEYFCVVKGTPVGQPLQRHRWLMEQDGHWSFIRPISSHAVAEGGSSRVLFQGDTFREFSTVRAFVHQVQGEHLFESPPGDTVMATDFIRPPQMLSRELSDQEEFWTLGDYVEPDEVREGFGVGNLPRREGMGPHQPNQAQFTGRWMAALAAVFTLVVAALYLLVGGGSRALVYERSVSPAAQTEPTEAGGDVAFYSEPFTIGKHRRNVEIRVTAPVENAWLAVDAALVHEATGQVRGTTVGVEYYHGVDDGESWSEGGRTESGFLGDVAAGTHVLRLDADCAQKPCPPFEVRVFSDVPRPGYAFMVALLLWVLPLAWLFYALSREGARWQNSTVYQGDA